MCCDLVPRNFYPSRPTLAFMAVCCLGFFVLPTEALTQGEPVSLRMLAGAAEPTSRPLSFTPIQPVAGDEQAILLNEEGVELVLRGERESGIAKIKQALELDPDNTSALYNLAGLLLADGKSDDARKVMRKVLDLEPDDLAFLNRYAESCVGSNDIASALAVYEKMAEADEKFADVLLKIGSLYGMEKRWDKAEVTLLRARKVMGEDSRVLGNLGSVLVIQEKYAEAIDVLNKAQSIEKNSENAVVLGIASESLGRLDDSIAFYREALDLGEKSSDLAEHLKKLQNLKSSKDKPGSEAASLPSEN